jgi:hypothetical protein
MAALQASDKCSHTPCMLCFLDRPDALPLNLIWGFKTTSKARRLCGPAEPGCLLATDLYGPQPPVI